MFFADNIIFIGENVYKVYNRLEERNAALKGKELRKSKSRNVDLEVRD